MARSDGRPWVGPFEVLFALAFLISFNTVSSCHLIMFLISSLVNITVPSGARQIAGLMFAIWITRLSHISTDSGDTVASLNSFPVGLNILQVAKILRSSLVSFVKTAAIKLGQSFFLDFLFSFFLFELLILLVFLLLLLLLKQMLDEGWVPISVVPTHYQHLLLPLLLVRFWRLLLLFFLLLSFKLGLDIDVIFLLILFLFFLFLPILLCFL